VVPTVATVNGVWANLKGSYKCDDLTNDKTRSYIKCG